MIKCKNGKVVIKGDRNTIMADMSVIVNSLRDALSRSGYTKKDTLEMMRFAFELGLKDEEELHAEAEEVIRKIMGVIGEGNKEEEVNE